MASDCQILGEGGGHRHIHQGSQPLWKSGKTLKMSVQFFSQGKLREFAKKTKNQGKLREFDSDPEGKAFRQFGVCVSCAMCPS